MKMTAIACAVIVAVELLPGMAGAASQPVATDQIDGVTVQILVEGGKLLLGANDVALELRPSAGVQGVRDVVLTAAHLGAAGESFDIDLSPDGHGRFYGTVMLPWMGRCRLEVAWRDDHGRHSRDFVVPVVAGHH